MDGHKNIYGCFLKKKDCEWYMYSDLIHVKNNRNRSKIYTKKLGLKIYSPNCTQVCTENLCFCFFTRLWAGLFLDQLQNAKLNLNSNWKQVFLVKEFPTYWMKHIFTKIFSLFIWNSSLTGSPIIFGKFGNSTLRRPLIKHSCTSITNSCRNKIGHHKWRDGE